LVAASLKEKLYQRILDEHGPRIRRFARANTRGDIWQDLQQDIMLRIWQKIDSYEGRAKAKTWVYAIAYNILKENNRKLYRQYAILEALELHLKSLGSTYSIGESIEASCIIDKLIQLVDAVDRNAFLMHLDGCTYQEISEVTKLDEGALRMRIHRLNKQLAEYVGS
jgi:RNA polymerase sigma-70 factor, ECF subfamily